MCTVIREHFSALWYPIESRDAISSRAIVETRLIHMHRFYLMCITTREQYCTIILHRYSMINVPKDELSSCPILGFFPQPDQKCELNIIQVGQIVVSLLIIRDQCCRTATLSKTTIPWTSLLNRVTCVRVPYLLIHVAMLDDDDSR